MSTQSGENLKDMLSMDNVQVKCTELRRHLLALRNAGGGWDGQLSSSALSTAVAMVALSLEGRENYKDRLSTGERWLRDHQNSDGSWGDTPDSPGNLATTMICWATLRVLGEKLCVTKAEEWLHTELGSTRGDGLIRAVLAHYGRDRTFSVPILVLCAACGALDDDAWRRIPRLPSELALLPRALYRWIGLPVVSYALPALISMGLCVRAARRGRHEKADARRTRALLRRMEEMQPTNGGFLEAIPLTGFVVLSLVHAGLGDCKVVTRGVRFLISRQREDGSWPIDTELATWVTTLSIKALCQADQDLAASEKRELTDWLLQQQCQDRHPFTGATPGGWGWSPMPGSVPDADDTAGALIALACLDEAEQPETASAAAEGIRWLLELQNRDGGIPTFCRGWGALPFDRSCPDLTAHAIQAWRRWLAHLPALRTRIERAEGRALRWLTRVQRDDGAWIPLWFGNQKCTGHANPVYGTAVVVRNLHDGGIAMPCVNAGRAFLRRSQNDEGSWGGDAGCAPSIEETALAVSALAGGDHTDRDAAEKGAKWLCNHTQLPLPSAPIGLYFASLWYDEALYPLLMTVDALERVSTFSAVRRSPQPEST